MITISRSDLETQVPAARHKDSRIFNAIQPRIELEEKRIYTDYVGQHAAALIEADDASAEAFVARSRLVRTVCLRAFADEIPSLDVVLTATGFGVVSTQDVAPASRERVEALLRKLDSDYIYTLGDLLRALFRLPGWAADQLEWMPSLTIFYHPRQLEIYAGQSRVSSQQWNEAKPVIDEAIEHVADHISTDLMERLVQIQTDPEATPATEEERRLRQLILYYVGSRLQKGYYAVKPKKRFDDIIDYVDANLAAFPLYKDSRAYLLNHHATYENKADSPAYHFVG